MSIFDEFEDKGRLRHDTRWKRGHKHKAKTQKKLTEDDVREIRRRWAMGLRADTFQSLGKEWDVSSENIHQIIRNKIWRDVK